MQDSSSFWTDIKNLEEQLANSPGSFCFARLADVYLKVGLVDDALHTARQGVAKHPRYLSGQRALSMACHAKGLNDEALAALQLIAEAQPEDSSSLKLLGRLYAETGNHDAACQAYRTVLEFAPDDVECQLELESLEGSAEGAESALEPGEEDEGVIEDLDILEELDILEDDQPESGFRLQEAPPGPDAVAAPNHDPLATGTLAELYVRQGFIHKALEIYRAMLAENPANRAIADRVAELEAPEAGPSEPDSEFDGIFEEGTVVDDSASTVPADQFFHETGSVELPESHVASPFERRQTSADGSADESSISMVPLKGTADNALLTLDGLLENIRRIKSCR
ncbi:MAG TPA: tetratricopeptide repeat protein [Dongiaceae bacterium]|nr:tetratricopeptide repeat protein [Dongiaceae bacterium]